MSDIDKEKIKLADLDLEIDAIENKLQSKGKSLVDKAGLIVGLAARFTGIAISKEKTNFNPARLAEVIDKLDPSYSNSPFFGDLKECASEYLELEEEKNNKENERKELKKKISFTSKLSK